MASHEDTIVNGSVEEQRLSEGFRDQVATRNHEARMSAQSATERFEMRIVQLADALDQECKQSGYPLSEWRILLLLHREEGVSVTCLAARAGLTKCRTSRKVQKLEELGIIERRTPGRRSHSLYLTEYGRREVAEKNGIMLRAARNAISAISFGDLEIAISVIEKMLWGQHQGDGH